MKAIMIRGWHGSNIWTGALAALLLACHVPPLRAQTWAGSASEAGLSVGGELTGVSFRCLGGGRTRLIFSGFSSRLQPGTTYTVALTIDGTAYLYATKADDSGYALTVEDTASAYASLIEALRKGRSAEVSAPAGRYQVPLRGSGDALARFSRQCR